MKYRNIFGLKIIVFIFIICVNTVYAESKHGFTPPVLNIDVGIEKFPNNFKGDDIDDIVKGLRNIDKKKLEKDSFETKLQYNKRLENIVPRNSDLYFFKIETGINTLYDPDKELLVIKLKNFESKMDIRIKTYKSKKGFLKEMRYTLQYVGNHNIANANSDLKCYYADCESKIPMIPQVAKQNREHIKGMVICNIIPIYDFGYYLKEDDLSHYKPGTEIDRKFEVSVRPIGIWIYNESTGEIYKKISYGN